MKIVISGYYGHGNFGDETILRVIFSELKNNFKDVDITVLPNGLLRQAKAFLAMTKCDMFISGGGSLLQDVTSVRSLVYYLGLLYLATTLNKKTVVYSQGIGPVNSNLGKFLLKSVLKKVDLITVRDKKSHEYLKKLGIKSTITADPAWALDYNPTPVGKNKTNIGIQLRKWPDLNNKKLKHLANAISESFKGQDVVLNLISLQDKNDTKALNNLGEMIEGVETKLLTGLSPDEAIDYISDLDYLIAMRYHACLVAAKYSVPFFAIAYDPKVKTLAKEANAPYVSVKDMNFNMLANGIKYLINEKDKIKESLNELSLIKAEQALVGPLFMKFFRPRPESEHKESGHDRVNIS